LVSIANLPTFFIQSSVKVPPTWLSGALRRGTDDPSRHGMLVLSPSSGLTIDSELVRLPGPLLSVSPLREALGCRSWAHFLVPGGSLRLGCTFTLLWRASGKAFDCLVFLQTQYVEGIDSL
jgi:hypothetical protein